jgi:hypothetical protein
MRFQRLISSLARIASRTYQIRYAVNGTKDEYVLTEELVEDAVTELERILRNSDSSANLSNQLRTELENCYAALQALSTDDCRSTAEMIDSPEWVRLRAAAMGSLRELGIDDQRIDGYLNQA